MGLLVCEPYDFKSTILFSHNTTVSNKSNSTRGGMIVWHHLGGYSLKIGRGMTKHRCQNKNFMLKPGAMEWEKHPTSPQQQSPGSGASLSPPSSVPCTPNTMQSTCRGSFVHWTTGAGRQGRRAERKEGTIKYTSHENLSRLPEATEAMSVMRVVSIMQAV